MIPGQARKDNGKFGLRKPGIGHPVGDGERLTATIKFRTTEQNARRLSIMFHQHRDKFGWQVPPDMFRELMMASVGFYDEKIRNPSPEMIAMKLRHDELQRMQAQALRHADFDQEMEQIDAYVESTMRAGDLEAVQSMLSDFRTVTRVTKDVAIKARREMEYDRRWKRLHEGLNRNASFNPADFVGEEEQ